MNLYRTLFFCLLALGFGTVSASQPVSGLFDVSSDGRVSIVEPFEKTFVEHLEGTAVLEGCKVVRRSRPRDLPGGSVEIQKHIRHEEDAYSCLLIERFLPIENGMHWEIEIQGEAEPWTTAIRTQVTWKNTDGLTWWTAWGDNRPDAPKASTAWTDPLVPVPFQDASFSYGSRRFTEPQAISIPILTVLDDEADRGITLALSPEDTMLDMELTVSKDGSIAFSRTRHRITTDRTLYFSMDLIAHEGDWRAGLGWMVKRYPAYFDPPSPKAHDIAGCGAYSSHTTDFDAGRLMRMAFRINWKASFDFPYMGMFIPPVPDDETEWIDFKKKTTSIHQMREDILAFTTKGFHVLNYFNVTEFGAYIQHPPPPRKAVQDTDLWRDPNDFTYIVLGDAILKRATSDKPLHSWEGCVAMDPGEPTYQNFLVNQAKRHIELFPESSGICIDRMDWLRYFNPKFDDGVSWGDAGPARSLVLSWHEVMDRIAPMMHDNGKVIFCNPHYRRLDLLRHVDGVYDEFGQFGHSMNLCALLCVRKPVMEWTIAIPEIQNDPDRYFQRHLHMGAFLTAPIAGNDHTILPSADVDQAYTDYGPLLDALRGKRWVLEPHAIEATDTEVKANLFQVPGGYVVPITFGGNASSARVTLRHLKKKQGQRAWRSSVIHPGETDWSPMEVDDRGDYILMNVPLDRGCAMVKLSTSWMEPTKTYFTNEAVVTFGTTIPNGIFRYTLDGSVPTAQSPSYSGPISLREWTLVRMALFANNIQVGDLLTTDYVRVPLSPPEITPRSGIFEDTQSIEITPVQPEEPIIVRYTMDGTDPSADSPRYEGPFQIAEDAIIQARVFGPGTGPGECASATFRKRLSLPPNPDIYISDLEPVVSTVGYFETAKVDRSTQNKPIQLAGKHYEKGMGVSAHSELAYTLQPEFKAFVAVVGIDDEMIDFKPASVTFQVWTDDRLLEESPLMKPGQYWHLNVKLPEDAKRVRLIVTDGGDGIHGDHGDWANAGFVTH